MVILTKLYKNNLFVLGAKDIKILKDSFGTIKLVNNKLEGLE